MRKNSLRRGGNIGAKWDRQGGETKVRRRNPGAGKKKLSMAHLLGFCVNLKEKRRETELKRGPTLGLGWPRKSGKAGYVSAYSGNENARGIWLPLK